MSDLVDVGQSRKRLTILWLSGSFVLFVLMFLETRQGPFAGVESEAWGWFLPNVVPTLSLMIGVLVQEARTATDKVRVDSLLFWLCVGLSLLYLIVILILLLSHPLVSEAPINYLKDSNIWLGPLQGLVAASLGAFFVKR